jgi:hypothetical protein
MSTTAISPITLPEMGRPKLPSEDPLATEVQARFWANVQKEGDCWEWQGATRSGYGSFYVRNILGYQRGQIGAHRYSYWIHYGEPPPDLQVRHKCDNKVCVNPAHLLLGTAHDNMQDALERGRLRPYERMLVTHCKHGHEYTAENTQWIKGRWKYRRCRTCARAAQERYRRRHGPKT